jgi:hypothetical protein
VYPKGGGGSGPPGFAMGTPSARPGWAVVGERGPELIHMRGGETVIPNHHLRGYADGAGSIEMPDIHVQVLIDGQEVHGVIRGLHTRTTLPTGTGCQAVAQRAPLLLARGKTSSGRAKWPGLPR